MSTYAWRTRTALEMHLAAGGSVPIPGGTWIRLCLDRHALVEEGRRCPLATLVWIYAHPEDHAISADRAEWLPPRKDTPADEAIFEATIARLFAEGHTLLLEDSKRIEAPCADSFHLVSALGTTLVATTIDGALWAADTYGWLNAGLSRAWIA